MRTDLNSKHNGRILSHSLCASSSAKRIEQSMPFNLRRQLRYAIVYLCVRVVDCVFLALEHSYVALAQLNNNNILLCSVNKLVTLFKTF